MSDRDFYPAGAYNDQYAPYNDCEVPDAEFDLNVQITITKTAKVSTNDYVPEYDDEIGRTDYNTSQTDWAKAYKENEPSIFECLDELKKYIENELESPSIGIMRKSHLQTMLKACEGWEEVEIEFEEV